MSELYQLPDGWAWKKLGCITTTTSGGTPSRSNLSYWGGKIKWLKSGELNDDYIDEVEECITELGLQNSSAKLFRKNTLLIAMYGATVGRLGLLNVETTTNQAICAILNDKGFFENRYIFFYLLSIRKKMLKDSFGGAQPNLSQAYIKNLDIPLPPLAEQKRIVQKLDALFERIDKAIALLQKNINAADSFMNSVLNDVFSDLKQNYPMASLFKIADVNRGKSKHRPRNDKRLFGGDYPFIQTGDVRSASKYITNYGETYSEFGLSQSKLWQKGTICMTIAANIGDVAILGLDSCFPDSVVGIFSESESNEYLYYYLLTLKKQLETKATTTAQMNINIKVLQDIELPLPSIDIQKQTVEYLDCISNKIEQLKSAQQQKMQNLLDLKSSILDQAFHGKL